MLRFCAEVDNKSNREMSGTFVNLVEIVTYKTSRKNRTERRVVAERRRGRIDPGDTDSWDNVLMDIPPLPPTRLGGACSIIEVQYSLEVN